MSTHKLAFLFPGQGSQAVGMGLDLYEKFPIARQTFEEADDALGFSLSKLCFEGPEEQLRLTEFTQPAIFTVSIAAQRVLAEKGIRPDFVAGHALGLPQRPDQSFLLRTSILLSRRLSPEQ